MADKQPAKTKRVVKSPETFRERAIKASEESDKPKRGARLKQAGKKAAKPVLKPVGKAASKTFARKPFILIGKVIFPTYIRNSWKELRLVTWPTLKQSRQLTFAVLVFALIFGAVIAFVDYGLDKLFRNVLLK